MVTAHRNESLEVLDQQLKKMYPGIVIGWIGNEDHKRTKSAHNPNSAGRVNALDPMIGIDFTFKQCQHVVDNLIRSRDTRINNIIFNKRIWDDAVGYWAPYHGKSDHTDHAHIEVHDSAYLNKKLWTLDTYPIKPIEVKMLKVTGQWPLISEGADDSKMNGYNIVAKIQRACKAKDDGVWGPETSKTLGFNTMNEERYRNLFGLDKAS